MPRQKQKKQDRLPVILMLLGGVLLLGAGLAVALQAQPSSPAAEAAVPTVDPLTQVERVTLEEAKTALDGGQAVFVDVRGPGAYEVGRIPGSVLIPLNELEQRWQELDPQDWIITYCTWPAEESSARAVQILMEKGFTRANPLLGGYQSWVAADYPVETGP